MTGRYLHFYRCPPVNGELPNSPITIDVPFDGLVLAAAKETLITGLSAGAWSTFFEHQVEPGGIDDEFRWLSNGLGRGGELRRSFSNILGRVFARWYLQNHEGVRALVPIEHAGSPIAPFLRVNKLPRESGDMPDWVGCTGSQFVLAEAKGRHTGGRWDKKIRAGELPDVVEFAYQQTERAVVVAFDLKRGCKRFAVASRWGTVTNKQEPWLVVKDPEEDGAPLEKGDWSRCESALVDAETAYLLSGAGFSRGLTESLHKWDGRPTELLREFQSDWRTQMAHVLVDGERGAFEDAGLNVLFTSSGFLPIKDGEDTMRAQALVEAFGQAALLQIGKRRLPAPEGSSDQAAIEDSVSRPAEQGRATTSHEITLAPLRRGDTLKVEFI